MIDKPGIYHDIPAADYHGREICPGPSISASGLKKLLRCPLKYWHDSPLNPNRVAKEWKREFAVGSAAHDLIADPVGWNSRYHILPEGFTRAGTKKWAAEIEDADNAEARGMALLRYDDYHTVVAMAQAFAASPISQAFQDGKPEVTLAWQDEETGMWLRCRPDWLPNNPINIPDYKTTTSAHPEDFARDVAAYGYYIQAAMYLEGIAATHGPNDMRQFYFVAQEKEPPYIVQPYVLNTEAMEWGRAQFRKAVRLFARCLETNKWPAYAEDFLTIGLPYWQVKQLEQGV